MGLPCNHLGAWGYFGRDCPQAYSPEYGITVIWALIGIIVANLSGAVGVMILAAAGIIVVAGATWKARSPA